MPISVADLEVTLDLEPERLVSGTVVDAQGTPAAGARIDVLGRDLRTVVADDVGAFALPELPSGPVAVVAWDEPRRGEVRVSSPMVVDSDARVRPVLVLVPAAALRVVRDGSGEVPFVEQQARDGVWVPVHRLDWMSLDAPLWLAPGPYRVRAPFGPEGEARLEWISAGETREVRADEADRRSGRRVAGRVVRANGTPIRWARLQIQEGWWELAGGSSRDDGTFVLWGPRRRSTLQIDGGAGPFELDLPADGDVDLGDLVAQGAP
ncbi:MAG: carboxypeptidase-like regulatory domain-containing protein [Planctomycetes bacterium]|nr:carboxypeptidase-like regulatory domain-containing protein [Planctomycetota bacterium]